MELSALWVPACLLAHLTGTAATGLAPGVGEAGGAVGEATQALSGPTEGAVLVVLAVGVADALHTFAVDSAPPAAGAVTIVVASTPPVGPGVPVRPTAAPFSIFDDRFNMTVVSYNSYLIRGHVQMTSVLRGVGGLANF